VRELAIWTGPMPRRVLTVNISTYIYIF